MEQTLIAGSYYALGFATPGSGALRDAATVGEQPRPGDDESRAAQLLGQLASFYARRWDQAEDELAGLFDVALARPAAVAGHRQQRRGHRVHPGFAR